MSKENQAIPTGIKIGNKVLGYSAVIRQLDKGEYDKDLPNGMRLIACVLEGAASGWIHLPVEKLMIIWRWIVVAVFIEEQRNANGTVDIPNDDNGVDRAVIYKGKNGGIGVYPGPLRFVLANHVESCAIEKYGVKEGPALATRMYQDMTESGPNGFRLSALGHEGLEMLHDDFIKQIQTEGIPDMPVIH